MAFCSKCGTQIAEGVKFCTSCGAPTGATATPAAKPAKEKVGNVRVCPNCGETIGSFQARCPSCGHELNSAAVAGGIKEFTDKLQKTEDSKKRKQLIADFPIPNSKEDLLEFAILVSSKLKQEPRLAGYEENGLRWDDDHESWKAKWDQVLQKIKLVLKGDNEAQEVIFGMQNDLAEFEKLWLEKGKKEVKQHKKDLSIGLSFLKFLIPMILLLAVGVGALNRKGIMKFFNGIRNSMPSNIELPDSVVITAKNFHFTGALADYFTITGDGCLLEPAERGTELTLTADVKALKNFGSALEKKIAAVKKEQGWKDEELCRTELESTDLTIGKLTAHEKELVDSLLHMEAGATKKIILRFTSSEKSSDAKRTEVLDVMNGSEISLYTGLNYLITNPKRKGLLNLSADYEKAFDF